MIGPLYLNMFGTKAVSIFMGEQVDQVAERAEIIRDFDKLYCDAIRAFRRGQGGVQLQVLTNQGSPQPDKLCLIVTGQAAAAEMFYIINALMDAWDKDDELPQPPETDK